MRGTAVMLLAVARALRPVARGVRQQVRPQASVAEMESRFITGHPDCNVTPYIANLVGRDLHKKSDHPLGIIKDRIEAYFAGLEQTYDLFDGEDPIVTTTQCFDDLNIPPEHPGRSKSDTYYINDQQVLRTHTSAHQSQHLCAGHEAFCARATYIEGTRSTRRTSRLFIRWRASSSSRPNL